MDHLDRRPTMEEIKMAVTSLGPDKAPGPDGYNAGVIQSNWEIFENAVVSEVQAFFQTGLMKVNWQSPIWC